MKIIDAHCHLNPEEITTDESLASYVAENQLTYTEAGLLSHMRENNVTHTLLLSSKYEDNDYTIKLAKRYPKQFSAAITLRAASHINNSKGQFAKQIKETVVRAIKLYLGYENIDVRSPIWQPLWRLAVSRNTPVIFHTGDTQFSHARLSLSHPLLLDELAVKEPRLKIVIAHFGNPWLLDAAEVVHKNPNVFADLSALFAGRWQKQPYLIYRLSEAIEYCGINKLMFGSDHPICRIDDSLKLISSLKFSKSEREAILGSTAVSLFRLPI